MAQALGPAPLPPLGLLLYSDLGTVSGTLAKTLGTLTSSAGTVVAGVKAPAPLPSIGMVMYDAGIFGATGKTLDALTSSSTVSVVVSGGTVLGPSGGKQLATLTVSSTGTAAFVQGSIDAPVSLPHLSLVLY